MKKPYEQMTQEELLNELYNQVEIRTLKEVALYIYEEQPESVAEVFRYLINKARNMEYEDYKSLN